jgi:hypothetical protein
MKKIFVISLMALSCGAFAQTVSGNNAQTVTTGSSATSVSVGGSGGTGGNSGVSGVTASNGLTVGCLVNCASTDQGSKDLANSAVSVANIQAAANRDIAAVNAAAAREIASHDQVIKNTPSVSGPALTASNDTCMGSTSGSLNIAGFGVGGGSSWVDPNCRMLKNSRELWNMGMKAAALTLMCNDPANREALELTGFECAQTTRDRKNADQLKMSTTLGNSTPKPFEPTDPFVRMRLGLAPLEPTGK